MPKNTRIKIGTMHSGTSSTISGRWLVTSAVAAEASSTSTITKVTLRLSSSIGWRVFFRNIYRAMKEMMHSISCPR